MTPKPEQEWRACRCAAGDPQHRPPDDPMRPCSVLGDMWYHTRDMSLWVGWDICQRCPVPDCDAALEAALTAFESRYLQEKADLTFVVERGAIKDALAKLRGTP